MLNAILIIAALLAAFAAGIVLSNKIIAELRRVRGAIGNDIEVIHSRLNAVEAALKPKKK